MSVKNHSKRLQNISHIDLLKYLIKESAVMNGVSLSESKNSVEQLTKIVTTQIKPIIDKTQQKVNDMHSVPNLLHLF